MGIDKNTYLQIEVWRDQTKLELILTEPDEDRNKAPQRDRMWECRGMGDPGSSPQPLDDAWMNREVKAQECKFIWASSLQKINYSLYFPKQIHDEFVIENWLGSFKFPSFSLVTKIRVLTEINRAGYLPQFTFSLCSAGINWRGEDGHENVLVGNTKLSISFWGTQVNMTRHSCQKK